MRGGVRCGALACALLAVLLGCTGIPRVELLSYTTAYTETQAITDGVLDIVAPYERVVTRAAATTTRTVTVPVRPTPAPAPAAGTPAAPAIQFPPNVNCNLLQEPQKSQCLAQRQGGTPPAAGPAPQPQPQTRTITVVANCEHGVGGPTPYCYERRDGWATIGDPPLVRAVRHLSNVVARYNAVLIAYASGISGTLLKAELNALGSAVEDLSSFAADRRLTSAAKLGRRFFQVVGDLSQATELIGGAIDREQVRAFVLNNYPLVDAAIQEMAFASAELYANVLVGTQYAKGDQTAGRIKDIRRLMANWTVLLDDNRRLLRELRMAIDDPNGLETRIRNLNESQLTTRIDTSAIKKQIATLGAPNINP